MSVKTKQKCIHEYQSICIRARDMRVCGKEAYICENNKTPLLVVKKRFILESTRERKPIVATAKETCVRGKRETLIREVEIYRRGKKLFLLGVKKKCTLEKNRKTFI